MPITLSAAGRPVTRRRCVRLRDAREHARPRPAAYDFHFRHQPDRLQQVAGASLEVGVGRSDRLLDAGEGAGFHRAECDGELFRIRGRRADDDGQRCRFHDAPGGFEAIHVRHVDVHQYDVGACGRAVNEVERRLAVVHRADHLDVRIRIEQVNEQHASDLRIVGHQHFDLVLAHE